MSGRILILIISFFLIFVRSPAQHADNSKVDERLRLNWIKSTSAELMKFNPDEAIDPVEPHITDIPGLFKISYRIRKEGLIVAENRDWIFIISGSSHDNELVGDISMAIDNKKRIFINKGHVCGGIIHFESQEAGNPENADQFFTRFKSDTDNEGWLPIDL